MCLSGFEWTPHSWQGFHVASLLHSFVIHTWILWMFYTMTCPWSIFNYKETLRKNTFNLKTAAIFIFYLRGTLTIYPLTAWMCTPLGWSVCQTKSSWDSIRHLIPEHYQVSLTLLQIWTWTVTFGRSLRTLLPCQQVFCLMTRKCSSRNCFLKARVDRDWTRSRKRFLWLRKVLKSVA